MLNLLLAALLATAAPPANPPLPPEPAPAQERQFVLTDDSDVRLDGRPCKFADVPETARVAALGLAADGKTILRLWFKSKGK